MNVVEARCHHILTSDQTNVYSAASLASTEGVAVSLLEKKNFLLLSYTPTLTEMVARFL